MKKTALVFGSAALIVTACICPPGGIPTGGSGGGAVCNPFNGGGQAISPENGLLGRLYYLSDSQPRYSYVEDYIKHGIEEPQNLYFNQLNTPTRSFSEGFTGQDGQTLKTESGKTLYEYFALHFESQIRLAKGDQSGRYQFAVLSDDGSIMSIDQGHGYQEFINNDGDTESRLACADRGINFDASTSLPIALDYFQGPRYNIALMLLWREVPETSCGNGHEHDGDADDDRNLRDVACNRSGNDEFFNWEKNPVTPTPVWLGMVQRGWKVVAPENFYLPDSSSGNPCVTASPSPSPSVTASPTPSPTLSGPVVCDPLGDSGSTSPNQGVVATLKSLPNGASLGKSIDVASFDKAQTISQRVYFSDINVPTQSFTDGFPGATGPLKDANGNVLTQYFSLTFTGEMKLAPNQEPGFYQFATISDDGSVLSLDTGKGLQPLVNNDYWHGSILEGSNQTVYMDQTSLFPFQLQYFQGAPVEIAAVVLMKKTAGPAIEPDPEYGMQSSSRGNGMQPCADSSCIEDGGLNFFDSSRVPSVPEAPYLNLLQRGWVALTPDNYQLPQAAIPNPCMVKPSPSPSPSVKPSPSPTVTASPSPSPTVSAKPSPSPSPSPTVTASPSPSPTVSAKPSPSPSPSPTVTASPSPSPTVSVTPSPSPSTCVGEDCGGGPIGI